MGDALLLAGVTLPGGNAADVLVEDGTIIAVGAAGGDPPRPCRRLDLDGYLLLPAPAEPHAHLDKALTAARAPNLSGDLDGAVRAWLAYRSTMDPGDVVRRATTVALRQLGNGATAIRSHVDVGPDIGLRALEALVQVREALPALPLTGAAGAANRALLRAAIAAGADVVGGCPHLDPDPAACQELCLELAGELGRPLDLHSDETLDPTVLYLQELAELVTASGFAHGVTASHCCSLGMQPAKLARRVAEQVAAAGISVVCCPQTNQFLQARGHASAQPRGLTALRALRRAGVPVAAGGDNVQDPFNLVGRGDPLEVASLLVAAGHLDPGEAYDAVSTVARAVLGLPEVRVEAGFPAELLAIRAASVPDAVAVASAERVVLHRGRVVCRTTLARELVEPPAPSGPGAGVEPPARAPVASGSPP